jgi:uroporphyrinogen-III decarboxylase
MVSEKHGRRSTRRFLRRGTEEQVVAATRRLLREVSARGPHIMSSANTISSSVRPENYLAMVRTTREFGAYPIAPG